MAFTSEIKQYAEQPISREVLLHILEDYKRPYDKISELVKQEMLIPVKSGIYLPGKKLDIIPPGKFLVANHVYGPSYVSLHSALSHWGLIPEKIYETTSVTTQTSRVFRTTVGRFSYRQLKLPYYSFGIMQVQLTEKQTVLLASPEKALCDKIVTTPGVLLRSISQTVALLEEDLRIDIESLKNLDIAKIRSWIESAPKKNSLSMLVKTLETL